MRGARILVVLALACAGLALSAPAAFAWHGRIQVMKINEGGNPSDAFTFHPTFVWIGEGTPTTGDFSLIGGETSQPFDVACNAERPGHVECSPRFSDVTLQVAERPTPGYSLADITCRYTQSQDDNGAFSAGPPGPTSPIKPASEVTTDIASGTVGLKVHYNEWVLCVFTNRPIPFAVAPVAAAPPQPVTTGPPQIGVKPARVRPGSAKLASPAACATSNVIVARVTGRRIVRVSFYVENRKVRTLNKPNRGNLWVLSTRVHGLPPHGPYRVKARVEFAKSSQTKPKTLRMSVSRCRSAASRPQFTG